MATPHGHRQGGGGRGGEFFVLSDKGVYLLFDSFAVAILLCSESPVISVSDITFYFFKPNRLIDHIKFKDYCVQFSGFLQVSSASLPFLTLVFNVPGARSSTAAPRYSPTKTHMHFEKF